jgi:DNA-binding MarR family transcriptional regulator
MDQKTLQSFRQSLRVIELEIERQMSAGSSCCGISFTQGHLLLEIARQKTINIKNLATIMDLDQSTLSRTIDTMVKARQVERTPDPEDRRQMLITLTKKGKELADSIDTICDHHYRELFKRLPVNKQHIVVQGLELLTNAIHEAKLVPFSCCAKAK